MKNAAGALQTWDRNAAALTRPGTAEIQTDAVICFLRFAVAPRAQLAIAPGEASNSAGRYPCQRPCIMTLLTGTDSPMPPERDSCYLLSSSAAGSRETRPGVALRCRPAAAAQQLLPGNESHLGAAGRDRAGGRPTDSINHLWRVSHCRGRPLSEHRPCNQPPGAELAVACLHYH